MIKMIFARTANGFIGKGGDLAHRDTSDLARFRKMTEHEVIVMGRKTFESLPGILPNRTHVILTRDRDYAKSISHDNPAVHVMDNVLDVFTTYSSCWIIGGLEVYAAFMPHTEIIYETVFDDVSVIGDTPSPHISPHVWKLFDVYTIDGITYKTWNRIIPLDK